MITALLRVTDIQASIDWYTGIGFSLLLTNQEWLPEDPVNWCMLDYGGSRLMLNDGAAPATGRQRDAAVFVDADDVPALYEKLRTKAKVLHELYTTFYGRVEFILEDPDGYPITFGMDASDTDGE